MDQMNQNGQTNQVMYQTNYRQSIPPEYTPISMWGYFGYEILFAIPCVGLILLIIFSLGGTRNINLKNFARSYFCFYIIIIVLTVIVSLMGGLSYMFAG